MKETIKNIGTGICTALAFVGLVIVGMTDDFVSYNNSNRCKYSDAIKAITESDMWSNDKATAIQNLPSDKDEGFYKAIIAIVNSNMWSSEKVEAIESIISNS